MEKEKLSKILVAHQKWLNHEPDGQKADLNGADLNDAALCSADLHDADLNGANLHRADLHGADLHGADLSETDLRGADLSETDLSGADLSGADLSGAALCGANLCGTNLRGAILNGADLHGTKFDEFTIGFALVCPAEGSFIGYKKADSKIVVLKIPVDAKRSSSTTLKCRCNKATVLRIENLDGSPADENSVKSDYDSTFVYTVGKTVEVKDFDEDRWNECSSGIHFFIDKQVAVQYGL